MSIETYLRAVPKAELHVHLEGTIAPPTLFELARRNDIPLPFETESELREWMAFRDFDHFASAFLLGTRCLRSVDDYALIVYQFGAEMARQNIRYAEVTFTPSTHTWLNVPQDVWREGLRRGRAQAQQRFGVSIRWIFDIVRSVSDPATLHPKAEHCLNMARAMMDDGVLGVGLGGSEADGPAELFTAYFDRARSAGLHVVPHAGEHGGPENIRYAVERLGAERIEHGVRAIEDDSLVELLARSDVALDMCPTSNVLLGVCPSLADHPLPTMLRAGVPITVNSDDPALFGTSLTDEVQLLHSDLGLTLSEIDMVVLNGVRHSFLPVDEKARMEGEFRTEMELLRALHLGSG